MPERPAPIPETSILIVDNDEAILRILSLQLRDKDWIVQTTSDPQRAEEIFRENATAVALLDVDLPEADGVELAGKLRAQAPELIIILSTGYPTVDRALGGLNADGADDYLLKPVRIDQLHSMIERAWRRVAVERENRELRRENRTLIQKLDQALAPPPEAAEEDRTQPDDRAPVSPSPTERQSSALASYERQQRTLVSGVTAEPESVKESEPESG